VKKFVRKYFPLKIRPIVSIVVVSLISIIWIGKINYNLPQYSNIDLAKYRLMAKASPGITLEVPRPYVYRVFAPWFVGLFSGNINTTFFILNSITLILLAISLYYFLLLHRLNNNRIALFVTLLFILNRYFFSFLAFDYFQFADSLSYLILIVSFFLVFQKRFLQLGILMLIGVLTREVTLLIIPVAYSFYFEKGYKKNDYLKLTYAFFPAILIFILLRLFLPTNGEETLFSQLYVGIKLFNPISILKKYFISITPFALLPIIFPKELFTFFKNHFYLFLLFLGASFSSLFGFDYERLMSPAAPVFFLFLAFIIKSELRGIKRKSVKLISYLSIFGLAVFSNLYHLWGFVKLPSRDVTIGTTIIANLLVAVLFLVLKKKECE